MLGDQRRALAAYQDGLVIYEHLAEANPASAERQRDLADARGNTNRLLPAHGDGAYAAAPPPTRTGFWSTLRRRAGLSRDQ